MGFNLRAAAAAVIIVSSSFLSGHLVAPAHSQDRSPAVAQPGDSTASRVGGNSNQIDPKQKARCELLQRELELTASQVQSYFNIYTDFQLQQSRAEARLVAEMEKVFILRSSDTILRLRMEIAKLKQQVRMYKDRHDELLEKQLEKTREFYGEDCLRVLRYL